MQTYEHLEVVQDEKILWVTLNRPESANAFSIPMLKNLVTVFKWAQEEESVQVVILTGKGKFFCAGGDVKDMQEKKGLFAGEPQELEKTYRDIVHPVAKTMLNFTKPLIAMVNGPAVGAGLDLLCACDMRIASQNAIFGETFVKIGLLSGFGGAYLLSKIVGLSKAKEMAFTGKIYKAEEAFDMGLILKICSEALLKERTRDMAMLIAGQAPLAVQATKKAFLSLQNFDQHLEKVGTLQAQLHGTLDHAEGVLSFLEKRPPHFHGK